ncbi:carbohydrate-binding domain-containing protein [Rhodovastum atsumiense]|uniref:carbohydrate-binding domain-containing protein n=1 Tax=Rhodovastum atsumiense TaxID=504468 RepID=UPI00139F2A6B|nr:carbohydrate-binding domain-containing protein [Rhodovastum atsumiense]
MPGLRQVFFDGFDGTSLDRSKWATVYESPRLYQNGAFRFDQSALSVGNGVLTVSSDKQANGTWVTGGISSAPWVGAPAGTGTGITCGRVEIRAKASMELNGAGPVLLLWPTNLNHWPPEVNLLETPRKDGLFTVHWPGPNGEDQFRSQIYKIDYSQWHTYTADWTPDAVKLYVDGRLVATQTGHSPKEAMSVGVNGNVASKSEVWYGGSPNASGVRHVDFKVDYISMAQWTGGALAPPGSAAAAPSGGGSTSGAQTVNAGSGGDALVLKVSGQAFQGDAQYTVKVDGRQIGGTLTARASHAARQTDTITLRGDWAAGSHRVEMTFLNDAWGGFSGADRNLYLEGASYNGRAIPGAALTFGKTGSRAFEFTDGSVITAPAATQAVLRGSSGVDLFRLTDVAGRRIIEDFEVGRDKLVFSGVNRSSVRIAADHDGTDHAWGQRVSFGTHGESVFLRYAWGLDSADMTFT